MTLITSYKHMTPTLTLLLLSISTHISYETVEAVRNFRTKTTDSSASVAAALSAIIIVAFCLFMCRVFCPNGPEFTALDLDEIRLERLQSIEDRIKQNIRDLKAKLNFHKKKRQTVERERDLKLRLQSYVAGEAADDSDDDAERGRLLPREEKKGPDRTNILEQENLFNSPIRNFPSPEKKGRRAQLPVTSPSPPPHKLIRDYEEEKEDKEDEKEEKEDLWKMWDKVATQKTATKTLTQHTDTAVEKQKSYHSIRYENKANRKEFLASMMSDPREEKADDYNTAMMYTESQWQSRPSAKKDQDYSINVSVKDYRSAEKYTVDVASNPLLSQQQAQQPSQTSSSTEIMSPLLKMAAKKQSDVTPHPPTQPPPPRTNSKPAPPKGPPPPHVLLKRKLEKMQAPQRVKGGEMEEEREKDD